MNARFDSEKAANISEKQQVKREYLPNPGPVEPPIGISHRS